MTQAVNHPTAPHRTDSDPRQPAPRLGFRDRLLLGIVLYFVLALVLRTAWPSRPWTPSAAAPC